MKDKDPDAIQGSLFEEDYLIRTLGSIATIPEVALTELVANAWDAGAARVEVQVPEFRGGELSVEDDGSGLTPEQFKQRWMTLGYNRLRHQGSLADMPPERAKRVRRAYGHNGVGRHGMLCFGSRYTVETRRDGLGARFIVAATSGKEPFAILKEETYPSEGHGTRLTVRVERNLPFPGDIRAILSARFLHDPEFTVRVNNAAVPLTDHKGLIHHSTLEITDQISAEIFVIDSSKTARTSQPHGIAFWVGTRLVGEPSWSIGERMLMDGRTSIAKRHTIVVRVDDLPIGEVVPDWSAFKRTPLVRQLHERVTERVEEVIRALSAERIKETTEAALRDNKQELEELRPLARLEVSDFVTEVVAASPTITPDTLSVAVKAAVNLEKSRSGVALLGKLGSLSESDIEGLNRLLENWCIRDALAVLDEIDRRIALIEAIEKLSKEKSTDELATLHPMVTQARWLFGPEFDSPMYTSNVTVRRAIEKVYGERLPKDAFVNYRNRPDLLVLEDKSTVCAVATDELDHSSNLTQLRRVLIVELKRGGFSIKRDEANQAMGYVEDLLNCGFLDGPPFIHAFVVGDVVDLVQSVRTVGENPARGRIEVCTYGQLVRTAEKRLFRLRDELTSRYEQMEEVELLRRATEPTGQTEISLLQSHSTKQA